jgi:hypothetical protein
MINPAVLKYRVVTKLGHKDTAYETEKEALKEKKYTWKGISKTEREFYKQMQLSGKSAW